MDRLPCPAILMALAIGILVDSVFSMPWCVAWGGLLAGLVGSALLATGGMASRRYARLGATGLLLLAVLFLGASRHQISCRLLPTNHILRLCGHSRMQQNVRLRGTALNRPEIFHEDDPVELASHDPRGDSSRCRFRLRVHEHFVGQQWLPICGDLWVWTHPLDAHLAAGDEIEVWGTLRSLAPPQNPGQRDWTQLTRATGVHASLFVPIAQCIRLRRHRPGLARGLAMLSEHWQGRLVELLPAEVSGVATALLLGHRDGLNSGLQRDFAGSGTAHLLCVSGLHVGILAGGMLVAARGRLIPYRGGLILVVLMVTVYTGITPVRAPVVRATLLVQLLCVGWCLRRRYSVHNGLAVAGIGVLFCNPEELFRPGTQLSFLAVLVLSQQPVRRGGAIPDDPLERLILRTRSLPWRMAHSIGWRLRWALQASAAVWLVTLPLVMHTFHLVAPAAIPMSVLTGPVLALILATGWAALAFDVVSLTLAQRMAGVCETGLKLLIGAVQTVGRSPWTHVWTVSPGVIPITVGYVTLGIAVWGTPVGRRRPVMALAAGIVLLGWLTQLTQPMRLGGLHGAFLSVGHGCCVVLQLPNGETWLYDAGRLGAPQAGVEAVSRYLWSRGVTRIDRLILTHADVDHYNMMVGLARRFRPRYFHAPGPSHADGQSPRVRLANAMREAGARVAWVNAPWQWRCGASRVEVIHPEIADRWSNDNAQSMVLRVTYQGRTILLTGDLEAEGLEMLLQKPSRDIDLAMLPHHGSLNSHPGKFASWSRAPWLVVSGGHAEVLPRLRDAMRESDQQILHTAAHGAIEFQIRNGRLEVLPFRPERVAH